jgi:uncharacterized Zn-finger protein
MHNTLHVHNLDPATHPGALEHLFARHGQVLFAKLLIQGDSAVGVVEMGSAADARAAAAALDGSEHHRRILHVGGSTPEEETAAGHPRMFMPMNASDEPPV